MKSRCEIFANYIIKEKSTIRKTAEEFGVSKSLVHHDISKKLPNVNKALFNSLKIVLAKNFNEKHIRGGDATKQKYKK